MKTQISALLLFCCFLTGCESQVLFSDLTETEANEIVAVLYSANLAADKVMDSKSSSYKVFTDKPSFSEAVSILQARGLPRERFESVGDVFKKDGFVSSPLEERARLNYAFSQELSRTIANIDGVIMARVHLAVPKKAYLSEDVKPSSASVFVKHRADVDLAMSVGKIKSLVVTGLENLPYENVTVGLFPAVSLPLPGTNDPVETNTIQMASVGPITPATIVTALIVLIISLMGFALVTLFRNYFPVENKE